MAKLTRKLAKSKSAVRKAYDRLESRVMAAAGRRAVRQKVARVKKVTRKAAKAGLIAGTVAAAGVVMKEIRRARREKSAGAGGGPAVG